MIKYSIQDIEYSDEQNNKEESNEDLQEEQEYLELTEDYYSMAFYSFYL